MKIIQIIKAQFRRQLHAITSREATLTYDLYIIRAPTWVAFPNQRAHRRVGSTTVARLLHRRRPPINRP